MPCASRDESGPATRGPLPPSSPAETVRAARAAVQAARAAVREADAVRARVRASTWHPGVGPAGPATESGQDHGPGQNTGSGRVDSGGTDDAG